MKDWPSWVLPATAALPPQVCALTTYRFGPGQSVTPFDSLNLGLPPEDIEGDSPATVLQNRELLCAELALPSPPHWLRQVHGVDVVHAQGPAPQQAPSADAAVTDSKGTVLAVLTADCLPVVFASGDGRHIGIAHAGWKGLAAGVLEHTVRALPVPAEELRVWLGPAAGPRAYEVGSEVYDAFMHVDHAAQMAFCSTRPGYWLIDMYALARSRLQQCGVLPQHITAVSRCTITEERYFYSFRRDGVTGRMATLVWTTP